MPNGGLICMNNEVFGELRGKEAQRTGGVRCFYPRQGRLNVNSQSPARCFTSGQFFSISLSLSFVLRRDDECQFRAAL